jgi:hypothetical protein
MVNGCGMPDADAVRTVAEPCAAMRDELAARASALARALSPTWTAGGDR